MPMKVTERPNVLINEKSPYLLQHAYNPVDWYPWTQEVLNKAEKEDKPIFLSIGYSACHWCHVMARETFQDKEIADILNKYFINIKVDREERPDIDDIYQKATWVMTGSGGWPLSVFLTPKGEPFYVGTYFPPDDKYGRPGFKKLATALGEMWTKEPEKLKKVARDVMEVMRQGKERTLAQSKPSLIEEGLSGAIGYLKRLHDPENGGFGRAPKFPCVNILNLLLQVSTYEPEVEEQVKWSLLTMSRGGIYDQLGGGFHRYSTDNTWLIPHFEKMLYDNALLASTYLDAYQRWSMEDFRTVAEETISYVLKDMAHEEGGFYSSEDADSEGEEGKFYVWRKDEVMELLGEETGRILCHYYDISPEGNFSKGTSVLHRQHPLDKELFPVINRGRKRLLEEREGRPRPFRDEKIIASWNGMMISALAKASRILSERRYIDAATKTADFILKEVSFKDGRLRRSYKDGGSDVPGFLDDYAYFISGLIELYQATFEERWLNEAQRLIGITIDLFWSKAESTFLYSSMNGLIARPSHAEDQSFPSGLAVAARALLWLNSMSGGDMLEYVEKILSKFSSDMVSNPWGFATLWSVADLYRKGPIEVVALVERNHELLRPIDETFIPGLVLVGPPTQDLLLDIWKGKEEPGLYICKDFSCSPPMIDVRDIKEYLHA
jgi:uncharacterized protein YyaL (SSP411 family)